MVQHSQGLKYNWTKAYNSVSNLGFILYGLALATAFLPIYQSNFYNEYQLSNFIRFTGLGISLSDTIFVVALVILSYKIVENYFNIQLNNFPKIMPIIIILLLMLPVTAMVINLIPESFSRVMRTTLYMLFAMMLLKDIKNLTIVWFGYITLIPLHLIAMIIQLDQDKLLIGLTVNSNIVAAYFLTTLILTAFIYLKRAKSTWLDVTLIIVSFLSIIGIIFSTSRGNVVGLITLLVILSFTQSDFIKKYYIYILITLATALSILAVSAPDRITAILHLRSFQEQGLVNIVDDFSAGRITSAENFLSRLKQDDKYINGYGPGNFTTFTGRAPAHNIFLQFIAEYGLVFAAVIAACLISLSIKQPLLLLPLLITGLVSYLAFFAEGTFIVYTLIGVALVNEQIKV